jgi:predicted aspartyl protease
VQLRLIPLPGVSCEMLNIYEAAQDGTWRLPDLVFDGEAWAALRLHVKANTLPAVGEALSLLQVSVSYRDMDGKECHIPESWLSMPVLNEEEFQKIGKDENALRRVKEAEAAKLQEFASRAAKRGDWNQVIGLLGQARDLAKHSPWLSDIVSNLEQLAAQRNDALFSKEARYSGTSMSSRVRSKMEFLATFDESSVPSHLQRKVHQGASGHYGQQATGKTYNLDLFDNHPVAIIDGQRVLLDTGSPVSIGNGSQLEIAGRPFTFHPQMGITTDKLSQWVNTRIDALLGTDVISQFVVTLDWWGGTVSFFSQGSGSPQGVELRTDLFMGTPVLQFGVAGAATRALFDTGAKLCYMPKSAAMNLKPINHVSDFHPMAGAFETDVYEANVEIKGKTFVANFGVLPDSLASILSGTTGIEWIIGTDLLRQGVISFDLKRPRITAVWKVAQVQ